MQRAYSVTAAAAYQEKAIQKIHKEVVKGEEAALVYAKIKEDQSIGQENKKMIIKSKSVRSASGSFIGTGPKKYMESTVSSKFRD